PPSSWEVATFLRGTLEKVRGFGAAARGLQINEDQADLPLANFVGKSASTSMKANSVRLAAGRVRWCVTCQLATVVATAHWSLSGCARAGGRGRCVGH